MRVVVLISSLALFLVAGCSETEVGVRIEVDDARATRVSVRVWDERHELVRDDWRDVEAFPRVVRLRPDADDPTASDRRWARVEVELWSGDDCPMARRVGTFRYRPGESRSVTLSVSAADRVGSDTCVTAFVDGNAGNDDNDCSEAAPCATLRAAEARVGEQDARPVIFLAGGHTYIPGGAGAALGRRTLDDPAVVRAWPGTSLDGMPHFDGNGRTLAFGVCCNLRLSSGERALTNFAEGLEIDGLEMSGGTTAGLELQGTAEIRVRNCWVHDNGSIDPPREREGSFDFQDVAGIRVHRVDRCEIEHNLIEGNRDGFGREHVAGVFAGFRDPSRTIDGPLRIVDNRIVNNGEDGIRVVELEHDVEVRGNTVCGNGEHGVHVADVADPGLPRVSVENNVVLDNGRAGVELGEWDGTVEVLRNTFAGHAVASLIGEGAVLSSGGNLLRAIMGEVQGDDTTGAVPDAVDCLLPAPDGAAGVCAGFPECE